MDIVRLLKVHSYKSYLVGECVTSLILGERVMDFDLVCDASIERITAIFDGKFKTQEDLLYKGELIIINGGMGFSVAPFRSRFDGNGRPVYCKTLEEDLYRRNFSASAVAYSPDDGFVDFYGGLDCIKRSGIILKAIDEEKTYEQSLTPPPKKRRKKGPPPPKPIIPALVSSPACILEAMLRFSKGEAEISDYTLRNMNENPDVLSRIPPAEIMSAFRDIIMGKRITETLIKFKPVLFYIFPLLAESDGYEQRSMYQDYPLFDHVARSVGYSYPDLWVRLSLLFHGVGKIDCEVEYVDYSTYDGHAERAVMLTREILEDYSVENPTIEKILFLIAHHDDKITAENKQGFISEYGEELTQKLLLLQSANIRAKANNSFNERLSLALKNLAEESQKPVVQPKNRTVTLAELKNLTMMLEKNGI